MAFEAFSDKRVFDIRAQVDHEKMQAQKEFEQKQKEILREQRKVQIEELNELRWEEQQSKEDARHRQSTRLNIISLVVAGISLIVAVMAIFK